MKKLILVLSLVLIVSGCAWQNISEVNPELNSSSSSILAKQNINKPIKLKLTSMKNVKLGKYNFDEKMFASFKRYIQANKQFKLVNSGKTAYSLDAAFGSYVDAHSGWNAAKGAFIGFLFFLPSPFVGVNVDLECQANYLLKNPAEVKLGSGKENVYYEANFGLGANAVQIGKELRSQAEEKLFEKVLENIK